MTLRTSQQPRRSLVVRATLLTVLAVGLTAGSIEAQSFTTRGFAGYGTSRGYGFGVGADAGVQFPFLFGIPAVAGVWGTYFAGTEFFDEELQSNVEQQITMYGVEGASVWIDKAVFLRGSGQLGAARIRHEIEGESATTETKFMLSGGIMVGKRWGDFVLSIEPVLPLVFGSDYTGAGFAIFLNLVYVKAP